MSDAIRRACDQCLGTDTQYECERGQCYAEHYLEQQQWDEHEREQMEWRRRIEEERND